MRKNRGQVLTWDKLISVRLVGLVELVQLVGLVILVRLVLLVDEDTLAGGRR